MAEPFVQSHLKRLDLFESLPDDQMNLVSSITEVLRFEPGTLVVQQNQPSQGMFLMVSGRGLLTTLEQNPAQPSQWIEHPDDEMRPGQYLGQESFLRATVEPHSLRIVEAAIMLFISRQRMATLLTANPELRTNLASEGAAVGDDRPAHKPLFAGQRSDEIVLQRYRRHWWSYVRYLWLPLGIATLLIVAAVLFSSTPLLALSLVGLAVIIPAGITWLLILEWQDDSVIVTDQRVVRINTTMLTLQNSISEIGLERINEVSIVQPPGDPFARLFDYSTVSIKTAIPAVAVTLSMVRDSKQLKDMVFRHRDRYKDRMDQQMKREIQQEVERALGMNPVPDPGHTRMQPPANIPRAGDGWTPIATRFINEKGEVVFRKHLLVWLSHLFVPGLLLTVSVVFFFLNASETLPFGALGLLLGVAGSLFALVWMYIADWDWRNDVFILNDDSLTIIRRRPLWLQNEQEQLRLSQVDSVVSDIQGIVGNLFDMGDVKVSLVGADEKLLRSVYRPQELQAEISRRQSARRVQTQKQDALRQREAMTDVLSAYHRQQVSQQQPAPQVPYQPSQPAPATPPALNRPPAQPGYTAASVPPEAQQPPIATPRDRVRPPSVPRTRPDDPNGTR